MKYKHYITKKELLLLAQEAFEKLDLPKIKVIIKNKTWFFNKHTSFNRYNFIIWKYYEIEIVNPNNYFIIETSHIKFPHLENKDAIVFSLYHEIAHYFQAYFYPKWFEIASKDYNQNIKIENYCDQRVEHNANKIAWILYKKLYLNKEKTMDTQIYNKILNFFNGDKIKTHNWFNTENPFLGNITPNEMYLKGNKCKLEKFIDFQLEDNI